MRVWAIHGMRRTGNHAVINWTGIPNSTLFFNDILTKEQRRVLLGETVAPHRFGRWLLRASARGGAKGFRRGWRWLLLGRVAVSFEDWRLDTPALVGWPKARRDILIVRDPFNLFASRIQMRGGGHRNLGRDRVEDYFHASIGLWKQHAREFLGDTSHLPGHVGVFYDRWLVDAAYRREVATSLGITPDESALGVVAKEGGGSSFEGLSPLGADAAQRRLSRYEQLTGENREMFEVVAADPEIVALRERLLQLMPAPEDRLAVA